MTRREERAAEIRAAGAEAVVCDVFDAEALREAVAAARPRGGRPRADGAAAEVQPEIGLPGGDQPGAERGDAQPGRGGAGGRGAADRRRERRLLLRARGRLGQGRGGAAVPSTRRGASPPPARRWSRSSAQVLGGGGPGGRGAALRLVLRPRHLLRPRRLGGRGNAEAPLPDRRRRARAPSPSSTSTTPPPRSSRRSTAAPPASTTSSTTSRRRCASGCRSTPRRSGRSRRGGSRPGWRGWSPAGTWLDRGRRCAAPPTPRPSASSAGSRRTRAGARASPKLAASAP